MKISKNQLIEMSACPNGLARFIKQTNGTEEAVEASSLVGGVNTISDLMWLAGKTLPKEKIVRFACDCALINIELIRPYTDKFELIVEFLKNPTTADALADAADAADAATCAADAATCAAARAAARAAAVALAAAADAADAADASRAATAAADAAGADDDAPKVNELLRELFK